MEQKKGNLWAGMTIFANYVIVLILAALLLGSLSALSTGLLGISAPSALLLALIQLAVVFSLWLGAHSVKKITPIDPKNYVAVSVIAASPIIILQLAAVLGAFFFVGAIFLSSVINFAIIDGLIIWLSYFFLSRKSISFKDNAKWILAFGAILFGIFFAIGGAKNFEDRLPLVGTVEEEMSEEERAEYDKSLNAFYEKLTRQGLEEYSEESQPQPQSPALPAPKDVVQNEAPKINETYPSEAIGNGFTSPGTTMESRTVYSHPDWDIFSSCEGQPVSPPVQTTIMESDIGIILIREVNVYNPEASGKYEITRCRGFIGWAPEGWFKNGKLEAYFKHSDGSQPLNVEISGPQRFAGLAPFKIDFKSFQGSARITRGTVIIIKANFNPGENPTLDLDVETVI